VPARSSPSLRSMSSCSGLKLKARCRLERVPRVQTSPASGWQGASVLHVVRAMASRCVLPLAAPQPRSN
jgi:hypothetical protein